MCGRYSLHANPEVVALQFGLAEPPEFKSSYNVCPGTDITVVRVGRDGKRVTRQHRWGLIPHWAKDPAIGNKLANARGESLLERPAFRDAFRRWRCLVPASGFYGWKPGPKRKQPYFFRPKGGGVFACAAIWDRWTGLDDDLETVSVLTMPANELVMPCDDRMPVVLGAVIVPGHTCDADMLVAQFLSD